MKRLLIILMLMPLFGISQVKVSDLPSATTIGNTDLFILNQGGTTKKIPYSVFKFDASSVGIQIGDSLTSFRTEVANQISDSIATITGGSSINFGSQYELPYTNATTNGYDYSSGFKYNGKTFELNYGTGNVFIGSSSGGNTSGTSNSFSGYQSGYSNTIGDGGVFLGNNSGYSNTSGDFNTFIGIRAGYSNTSANNNTFIGAYSGQTNVVGTGNSFVGYYSGYSNLGSFNSFLGYEAGRNNTSGASNNYIGYQSGRLNTTGSFNTFSGYQSGYSNTTSQQSVYLGYQSGYNANANYNTFIGARSGYNNTSGTKNIFIGNLTGNLNTTGSNNTYLGTNSGYNNINGSNNIFVGYQAGLNETGSNKLYIESSDANSSNALIYGEFDNNIINFNADATVTGELSVNDTSRFDKPVYIDGNLFNGVVTALNVGTSGQIPYVNALGTDLDYSDNFMWDGNTLLIRDNSDSLNVYIGSLAGEYAVGQRNVFIGESSGYGDLTETPLSSYNVFVGAGSGATHHTGNYNTFIGYEAGSDVNSGSGNVFIGNKAGRDLGISDNKLYIENSNTSNPLIWGDFAEDSLRFNASISVRDSSDLGSKIKVGSTWFAEGDLGGSGSISGNDGEILMSDGAGGTKTFGEVSYNGNTLVVLDKFNNYSTIIGNASTAPNNSGTFNVYIGGNSSMTSTTGLRNTVIGYNSKNGSNSSYNTTLGYGAGTGQSNVNYGVFIGYEAGINGSSGWENAVLVGRSAGFNNSISNTLAVGAFAGYSNTFGASNTFIGYTSGFSTTTGASNTFIGYQSGYSNITGSGNIFLGYRAGYNETGSNKLYIENSNSATPLIYGEFDNDYLKFNADSTTFTGTIKADIVRSKTKSHGFFAFEDSAVVIDCTKDTWVHITNTTNTLFLGVQEGQGFDISGDTITFNEAAQGDLIPHVIIHWGIDGYAAVNEDYEVRIFNIDNASGVVRKAEGTTTGSTNRITIGTTSYDVNSSFGDRYILQIMNKTNSNDFTIENGSIYIEVSHY